MKVLQVHTRYRLAGGEDAVAAAEAELLRAAGHEVRTLVLHNPEGARRTATALARAPWNRASAAHVRDEALSGARPDVVHVHNTWFALSPAVLPALHAAGFPVVLAQQNYRVTCASANLFRDGAVCHDCLGSTPLAGVRHRCYRGSAVASAAVAATIALSRRQRIYERCVDAFVVPSTRTRDLLVAAGLPADRLHLVPNVVADRPQRTSPPSASTTLLYVGRLTREKGVDVLLEAWQQTAGHGLVLEVAGEGPLAAAAGRTEGVHLLGSLSAEQVQERMRAARALLVPSVWDEPFGLVVAEAFSTGLPVVAARSGALPELLAAAGSEAWLVEAGQPQAWTRALLSVAAGPLADDVDDAGRRGRRAYEAHWTPERGLERLLAVYAAVTRGG